MNSIIKKILTFFRRERAWLKAFLVDIRTIKTDLHFSEIFLAYRKGFLPSIMSYSGINKENHKQYLSSKDYQFYSYPNGLYNRLAEIKLNIPYLLKDYVEYVPEYYFFKDTYGFLPLENYSGKRQPRLSIDSFLEILHDKKELACKPCSSRWGNGFMKVEIKNNTYFINNQIYPFTAFVTEILALNDYIITEYIVQHLYAQAIYPISVNTIRLLCVWDELKKEFFLARAFQRFGTNGSLVDNLKSGNGLAVFIDFETGEFTHKIISNTNKRGYRISNSRLHPDTGVSLEGVSIPNWHFLKNKILEISNHISFLKYVGYDIALTEKGFKILEINSKVGLHTLQIHDPLFTDERIKNCILTHKK